MAAIAGATQPPATSTASAAIGQCGGAVAWAQARNHVGETIRVRGPVRSARYASRSRGKPTFLNIGRAYPDRSRVQAVIWGQDRGNWPQPPETKYAGKTITVRGKVVLYQGVAEITVATPRQISVCR
jgi:hypothetical protein